MSWGITVYAEKKRKNSDKWELIGNQEILLEAKWCLITDDAENYRIDVDIEDAFYEIDNEELSDGLLKHYDGKIDNYHIVKQYPIDKMYELCEEHIKKYTTTALMCYKALGIKSQESDEAFRALETYGETDMKYTESGKISKNYNPLTFPINKELMIELNDKFENMQRAVYWQGIIAVVRTLAEEDWQLDHDCEIRLVFVRSC